MCVALNLEAEFVVFSEYVMMLGETHLILQLNDFSGLGYR